MIALDIWAGNTSFWKEFKRLNSEVKTVICWDPNMKKDFVQPDWLISLPRSIAHNVSIFCSRFSKILSREEIEEVIQESRKWVFKTLATYGNTQLPDESVDIITLNSPHPITPPSNKDFSEFQRVLKKGWVFYFWHSTDIKTEFDEEKMTLVWQGWFYYDGGHIWILDGHNLIFPMSPVIKSNVLTLYLRDRFRGRGYGIDTWFMYSENWGIRLHPNWKAWVKK